MTVFRQTITTLYLRSCNYIFNLYTIFDSFICICQCSRLPNILFSDFSNKPIIYVWLFVTKISTILVNTRIIFPFSRHICATEKNYLPTIQKCGYAPFDTLYIQSGQLSKTLNLKIIKKGQHFPLNTAIEHLPTISKALLYLKCLTNLEAKGAKRSVKI